MPSGLRNGARAPVAFNLEPKSVSDHPFKYQKLQHDYGPLHNIVVLLQPRVVYPTRFPVPIRFVDVHTHIDRPHPLLGMALDLGHDVLAGHGCPIHLSAQRVDNVAEGFVAGNGAVGVLDPELDRTGDLAFVSGEAGSVERNLGGF